MPIAPLVQYTDALPAGQPLEIQIYPGGDASFVVVEDDGETISYQHGQVSLCLLRICLSFSTYRVLVPFTHPRCVCTGPSRCARSHSRGRTPATP